MSFRRSVLLGAIPPAIALVGSSALSPQTTVESSPRGHGLTVLHWPAILSLFLAFLASSAANAQAPAGPNRPIGVPDGYVVTPSGYFHPSCVREVAEGDTLLEDGPAIRHANGTIEKVPVCQYPHYTRTGEIAVEGLPLGAGSLRCKPWIECAETTADITGSTSYGKLTATWIVPPEPTSKDGQTLGFFPGFQQVPPGQTTVLQPVLAWNASLDGWYIEAENCCPGGQDFHGPLVSVIPTDVIEGRIQQTCPAGTESCPTWKVVASDITSGEESPLPSDEGTSDGHTFNWAFAGALEVVSGLVQCSDYPPNSHLSFSSVALYDYNLNRISNPNWSTWTNPGVTPQCGYVVDANVAKQVTLYYLPTVRLDPHGTVQISQKPPPYNTVVVDGDLKNLAAPDTITVTLDRQVIAQCGCPSPPCVVFDRNDTVMISQGQTMGSFSDYAGRYPSCPTLPITTKWTITKAVLEGVTLDLSIVPPNQRMLSAVF
jgi:hypothetical protein